MTSTSLTRAQLELVLKENDKSVKFKKFESTDRSSPFLSSFSMIIVNDIIQDFVLCDKCRSIIIYKTSTGTGGLKKHLTACEKNSSPLATQSSITMYYSNKKPSVLPEKIMKELTNAYLNFVILDGRPFETESGLGFKNFIKVIYNAGKSLFNNQLVEISDLLPHPTTVSALL